MGDLSLHTLDNYGNPYPRNGVILYYKFELSLSLKDL